MSVCPSVSLNSFMSVSWSVCVSVCFPACLISVNFLTSGPGGDDDGDQEEEYGLLSVPGVPAWRADRTPGTAGVSAHPPQSHQGPELQRKLELLIPCLIYSDMFFCLFTSDSF